MNKTIALFALSLLIACSSQSSQPQKLEHDEVRILGNTLFYDGEITADKNRLLFDLNKDKIATSLEIDSVGGDVIAGIELGNWIVVHELDIKVGAICASSCANYVFPAGKNKILQENSVLLWHGSSYQPDVNQLVNSGDEFANSWRQAEDDFFNRVNINYQITICGFEQVPSFSSLLHKPQARPTTRV